MILALSITGASLSFFLLCFLANKPKAVLGDRWLGAWLGIHTAYFIALAVSQAGTGLVLLFSSVAVQSLAVLFAPAQYLQVMEATRAPGAAPYRNAVIAVLIATLLLAGLLTQSPALQQGAVLIDVRQAWVLAFPPLVILATLFFPVSALGRLTRYRRAAKSRLSNLEMAGLDWIRVWVWSTIAMLGVQLGVFIVSVTLVLPLPLHLATLLIAQCLQVGWAGFHGLRTRGVFQLDAAGLDDAGLVDRRDLAAAREDFAALDQHLAATQPHLDATLTSTQLADAIGWSGERLHRAIRVGGATHFHELINRRRLDMLATLIRDPANARVSLLGLAHDAGFGSKSAFYAAFKTLETGSPAAWRRNLTAP
ncbi:helix-turn-helix domain-containing protein [Maricaulis sp.]|uniref:AraC family transcriptional regulator n=1 Tax=Maricaulis sp. TaxID=1486257 RepID=UPI0025BF32D0|nr:helix-turn-helix domain-containing protein [Maricaulis sp.]